MPIDPFTSFMEGYQKSQQMGLLKLQAIQGQKEYAQKQQAAEAEAKKAKIDSVLKAIEIETPKLDLSPEIATPAFNNLKKLNKVYYEEMGLQVPDDYDNLSYDAATDKPFVKELQNLAKARRAGTINDDEFTTGTLGIGSRLYDTKNKDYLKSAAESTLKGIKGEEESSNLSQANRLTNLQSEDPRQFAAIQQASQQYPDVVSPVAQYRREALERAGTQGQDLLAKGMEPETEKDTATASLREFETVNGIRSEFRGTPQYKKAYEDWLKVKNPGAGSGQVVIMPTADGFAAINKKTGTATPIIGAGGESVNKPLTGEMITTQQQIGTVDDTFKRVKELYKPEFVGPIQGRAGAVRSATVGNPEDRATFYSALQDINNTLVYLKSGKQINEQEYERLKGAMPHRNLANSDFKARMIEFEKVFNSIITERQKNMGGYGQAQSSPQRRATDKGGDRRYNPATGRIE